MMQMVKYDAAHMDIFVQKPKDIEYYGRFTSETENPMAEYGTCFTAIKDGRVLVVGGVLQTSVHTAKCWTMVSRYAPEYGLEVFRLVKKQLEAMMETMQLYRVETANIKEAEEHHKWCRLLGFKAEGEMPMYDDRKRTYIRFAKLMEG